MKKNYLKIELTDTLPVIEMNYDSIESFQSLMFCLISESGFNLVYKTIEKDLIANNKNDELEVLKLLIDLIAENQEIPKKKQHADNFNLISPSSFK